MIPLLHEGLPTSILNQLAHIVIIFIIANKSQGFYDEMFFWNVGKVNLEALLVALLLLLKPTNILIKLILERYKISATNEGTTENQSHAGALIGSLERILTLCFVLIGQYEAIGFVIAAKSLLRFKDSETTKTEYVLAGTFLSFGSAILLGLAVILLSY